MAESRVKSPEATRCVQLAVLTARGVGSELATRCFVQVTLFGTTMEGPIDEEGGRNPGEPTLPEGCQRPSAARRVSSRIGAAATSSAGAPGAALGRELAAGPRLVAASHHRRAPRSGPKLPSQTGSPWRRGQSLWTCLSCERVLAAKHAARDLCRVLERRHGLAEIVERGAGVLAERPRVNLVHLEHELITISENASRHGYRFAQQ